MKLKYRLFKSLFFFLLIFFGTVIVSFCCLPEGILKQTNVDKDISYNMSFIATMFSIFARNIIVTLFLCVGNLVALRIRNFTFPFGYLGTGLMLIVNGITLGTWSFSARNDVRPGLTKIIMHSFDVLHNAGLVEILGVLLIVIALGRLNLLVVEKGAMVKCGIRSLQTSEWLCVSAGVLLIIFGAMIEAASLGSNF